MKLVPLTKVERLTLRSMGVSHPDERSRMRAQAILRLDDGLTLQQTANEFMAHLNSVENWKRRWSEIGLIGLFEGKHTGRPKKWERRQRNALRKLVQVEGGTAASLLRKMQQMASPPAISESTLKRYLKQMSYTYKRCRYSLKKSRNEADFERGRAVIASLTQFARNEECELLYFDEAGFSPNPPVQYAWTPIGQTRCAQAQAHGQRVNVLGALRRCGGLTWSTVQGRVVRDDMIAFFDQLAAQPHTIPRIVVLDNASIHKGPIIEERRKQWATKDLYLYYLPPYSPELNKIEILWKQAKYYWRHFVSLTGNELHAEINSLMEGFGKAFTINFA
ncbi:MAG TPA: IS630 family transposase [Methylomicrobium sp.]|nr:IS630 family transposase [Methylomicrobium sp.]